MAAVPTLAPGAVNVRVGDVEIVSCNIFRTMEHVYNDVFFARSPAFGVITYSRQDYDHLTGCGTWQYIRAIDPCLRLPEGL